MSKGLPWFRLYAEIVEDEIMQFISFEDQRHFVWLLALKCAGTLDKEYPRPDMLDRVVSRKLGLQGEAFTNAKKRLMEVNLIDENWQPINWDKRQFKSDADNTAAERKRRQRQLEKLSNNNSQEHVTDMSRVTVTNVTRTETEADTDTDTEEDNTQSDDCERPQSDHCPHQKIVSLYHECLPELPQVFQLTQKRRDQIRARWQNELPSLEDWKNYFDDVRQSDFLMGRVDPQNGRRRFRADLEWLTKASNITKVAEGRYHG